MFWKYGTFCSIFSGLVWGFFWAIIFTILGILTLGIQLSLNTTPFLIVGSVAALSYLFFQKFINIKFHLFFIIMIVLIVYCITFGDPYTQKDKNYIPSFVLVLITSIFTHISIHLSLSKISWGKLSRYSCEKFYLRILWGLGLMILILITLVP